MPEAYEVSGYIYARTNELCDIHDCYKLGTTRNIPDREANYITSEINRGRFKYVYEIQGFCNEKCEQMLFQELKRFNLYKNAGTEFYRKDAIKYIEPFFNKHNIKYKKLSAIEIANLVRTGREYIISNESSSQVAVGYCRELSYFAEDAEITESSEDSYDSDIEDFTTISYIPREYQSAIISNALSYFQFNNNGILALICGVGKTLTSLWITKELNCNTIVIGVPNILLLKQWKNTIKSIRKNGRVYISN